MLIQFFICLIVIFGSITCQTCEKIVPDAITQLQNGSIVVFEGTNFWLLDQSDNELVGPCPISATFKDMNGPIDAAVTIFSFAGRYAADSTELIGSSLFFTKRGDFFTFKNLRPYQIDYGGFLLIPFKGRQKRMGKGDMAQKFMPTQMSAAFFEYTINYTLMMFPKGEALGYTYTLGWEYDVPEHMTLTSVLQKYKVSPFAGEVTAAMTLWHNKTMVFFVGAKYCTISTDREVFDSGQRCVFQTNDKFFDCANIRHIKSGCAHPTAMFGNSGESNSNSTAKEVNGSTEPEGNNANANLTKSPQNNSGKSPSSLTEHHFFRVLIISSYIFFYILY